MQMNKKTCIVEKINSSNTVKLLNVDFLVSTPFFAVMFTLPLPLGFLQLTASVGHASCEDPESVAGSNMKLVIIVSSSL